MGKRANSERKAAQRYNVTRHISDAHGGYGYSREFPMERRMRDAWEWGIAGGAIDIQKVNIAFAMVGRRFDQRR